MVVLLFLHLTLILPPSSTALHWLTALGSHVGTSGLYRAVTDEL